MLLGGEFGLEEAALLSSPDLRDYGSLVCGTPCYVCAENTSRCSHSGRV